MADIGLPLEASGGTATDQTGRLDGSKRVTRGYFTSARKLGRITATCSRTSSAAFRPSISS